MKDINEVFSQDYTLTDLEHDQCVKFMESSGYSEYAHRNQDNLRIIQDQILVGKMGELIAYFLLKPYWENLTYPDFKIYTAKQKSWAADMKNGDIDIHIKTQDTESARRFGDSWTFNLGNIDKPGGKDAIYKDDARGYVAFVTVDKKNRSGVLRAIVPILALKKHNLFQMPKSNKLWKTKEVVYVDLMVRPDLTKAGFMGKFIDEALYL